ncbi:MAG: DUF1501 domain-containing protein [Planctomycetaceae bacterium]
MARRRRHPGWPGDQGTDAIGLRAVEKPYHLRDIHTTILHQLGLDPPPHLSPPGRNERLTFVEGKVIEEAVG